MLDGFWQVNSEGYIVETNDQYLALSGYTRDEVINSHISDFELFESDQDVSQHINKIRTNGSDTFETKHIHKNGSTIDVEVMASFDPNKAEFLFAFIRDISKRKHSERQLVLTNQVIEASSEGILITDETGAILFVNKAFTDITGYSKNEALGKTPAILNSGIQSPLFYEGMWKSLNTKGNWVGEVWNKKKNGEIYPEWLTISSLKQRGTITHYIAHFSDLSETKQLHRQQEFLEYHDPLTGLANQKLLKQRMAMAQQLFQKQDVPFAVFILDLDRFKLVNDSFGHEAGDLILQEVAKRLTKGTRISDTVARFSGNQFVIVMSDHKAVANINNIATNIIKTFEKPFAIGDKQYSISASLGVAACPEHSTSIDELLLFAETAMFNCKLHTECQYTYFDPSLQSATKLHNQLASDLQYAVENNQLELWYQPQVCSKTNTVVGIESLLRWHHPELGLISPVQFIPIAEENNLIISIGNWVIKNAANTARKWKLNTLYNGRIAVNVSLNQLHTKEFIESIKYILSTSLIEPSSLEIEVTESLFYSNNQIQLEILTELFNMGIAIAIDDFGTGYSSLSRIREMPISTIKIDKCFVDDIEQQGVDQTIVKAVIDIARCLNINVLAEGVETKAQAEKLSSLGCDYCQGYYYAKPMTQSDCETWLVEHSQAKTSQ